MAAPRNLLAVLVLLTLAACGMPQSGSQTAATAVTVPEPLDLALHPAPELPEGPAPRRPVSADMLRKTEAEARALLGVPTTLRREPPGEVWQYLAEAPRCTLLLFFYPEEQRGGRLLVGHAQVISRRRGDTVDDSECLAALLKTPIPSVQPAPSS